jgi:ubiquinone/menaquinone biosynthesis C-methylase UbiE
VCSATYLVEAGVPRLVEAPSDVRTIGRRFEFEWVSRWMGGFEGTAYCHGVELNEYVTWHKDRLEEHRPLAPGDRILDAGCGSGEKASLLARMCPQQTVVGLDLGLGNLEKAAAQYGDVENLDYVQGNILRPPLRWNSFRWGISIGVLHHTPDTRQAFAQFRKLLTDDAAVLIYLYRPYREAPEWRVIYFMRDVVFLGQSPKLPPGWLRLFSFASVGAVFPLALLEFRRQGLRMNKELPFFDVRKMTLRESYAAIVFHLFDLLLPQYQFRPRSSEVEAWFREERLEMVFQAHCFYLGRPLDRV